MPALPRLALLQELMDVLGLEQPRQPQELLLLGRELGRSSPTGLKFGTLATNFPPRYRRMMFACDWAFGVIHAIQFTPDGASYKAAAEPFVTGRPLNVLFVLPGSFASNVSEIPSSGWIRNTSVFR